jgi:hypothetical protein
MAPTPRPELLVVTMAVFEMAAATLLNTCRFTSRSSTMASKTQSAVASAFQSSSKLPRRRAAACSGRCSGLGLSLRSVSAPFLASALRSVAPAGTTSSRVTSRPWATRWAATCAPMVPAPSTTTLRIAFFSAIYAAPS